MASPQKKNGFTQIANELVEVIYGTNFTSTEFKVLLMVIRFTYGFQRKEHSFSLSFISNATGISKRHISSTLSKLVDDKVIIITSEHTASSSRVIKLNKNYEQWSRTRVLLMNQSSTDELQFNREMKQSSTGDEAEFTPRDELQFNREMKQSSTKKENIKENIKEKDNKENINKKEVKHKFGEFGHVLLSDVEMNRLINELGNEIFTKCIKKLDEYIEIRKPKYNNHNLVIRNWVIKAVTEDIQKENIKPNNSNTRPSYIDKTQEVFEKILREEEERKNHGNERISSID